MAILVFKKGENAILSDHFNSTEFDCPCDSIDCTTQIDSDLIPKLEALRESVQAPLRINSGYRCQRYQDELRARGYETSLGPSTHSEGRAADVMSEDSRLSGAALEPLARQVGFRSVGVGHSWIHVDLRDDKDRHWEYTR
jgi:uncharacterized protein YcbK (DUF882 family)